ncbi:MAG: DUF2267 domain-containing protein [Methylobacteriaceae bacterium]|nr:DUF2267 domain-containing protein [Methylobacteriaceae bacterium]MBV9219052.1 DUF2267 domain-containing protein [Methylobacteriaceae bacterium]MBV9633839.1 DUF2267 domain-containing protein [Methylobacteriaceae bacterium]
MSASGLDVFDKTLQTTHVWLDEIMDRLGCERRAAWHILGAVLRTLRDRIPVDLAAHLGAQLPLLVRGLYYDQWHPGAERRKWRSLDEFQAVVADGLADMKPVDPGDAALAVFQVLNHFVDPGQVAHVRNALPEEVRRQWPQNNADLSAAQSAA